MTSPTPHIDIANAITATGRKVRKSGGEFKAQCPAHDDKQASLQIGMGERGAVLKCHAGCEPRAIVEALGMTWDDLFVDALATSKTTTTMLRAAVPGAEAVYFYDDENGAVLFRVERRHGKKFVQARPDPAKPGEWLYALGDTRRVPYRLPNVIGAVKNNEPVYVVEGEKDVHTLEAQGLVASCNPGGAGKFKREFASFFAGAHVIVLPDNDDPGREHANQVVLYLKDVARSVKVVPLSGLPAKGDVSDWFAKKGNDAEKFEHEVDAAPVLHTNRPRVINAPDLMAEKFPEMVMAVPGLIAEGLTLLVGAPKIGKSWMSLGIGIEVARGGKALGTIDVEEGKVLYLALEDTHRRLQRRLNIMLGEGNPAPANLNFASDWPRLGAGGLDLLEEWLTTNPDTRLVLIDTWAKIKSPMPDSGGSMYEADYGAINAVKSLADQFSCAITLVHHQRKATDTDPLNTVAGSTGLTGAADATVVLTRPRGAEEGHLYVTGRDVEESRSIVAFDPQTGAWLYMGEADNVEEARTEEVVVKLVEEQGPLGVKDVVEKLQMKEGTAKWLLSKLAAEGKITRMKRGVYIGNGARGGAIPKNNTLLGPLPTGSITVTGTTNAMPGLPAALQGPGVPSVVSLTDEEIEALLDEEIVDDATEFGDSDE